MKAKISISIDENSIDKLEDYVKEGQFRNKSHIIEFALNKFLREIEK